MRNFFLSILILALGSGAAAQSFPGLQFNHLTTEGGLSSNTTTCLTEDKLGFIWIGTDNGLNRCDGYRVKQYFHHDADSNSLVFSDIQTLYCDRKGRIWITTGGGVSCFLQDKNVFVNYSTEMPSPRRLKNNNSVLVMEDKDGTIYLTNQKDVIFQVRDDMSLREIAVQTAPFSFENIPKEGYEGIMTDHNGKKWAYCANRIYLLAPSTFQPIQTFDFSRQLAHASIRHILEDQEGRYWISTWGPSLWLFEPASGKLKLAHNLPVTDILEWRYNDQSWLIAEAIYSGVYLLDQKGESLKKLDWNAADPHSLEGTLFLSLYTDSRRNLWICTNRGVNYVQASGKIFDIHPVTQPGRPDYERTSTGIAFSFFEDSTTTWLSTRFKATFVYDRDMQLKKFFTSLYPLSATANKWSLNAYYFFKRGSDLYISTDSGLVVYDLLHASTRLYFPVTAEKDGAFRTIVALDSSRILIRTVNKGLFIFNTITRTFIDHIPVRDSTAGPLPGRLNYLLKTSKGDLLLSGNEGRNLVRYIPGQHRCVPVTPSNDSIYHFLSKGIYGMEEDKQGRIWLAASDGIFIYNAKANIIEEHFTADGRMGAMFRICFDTAQNAWANGNSGVWCYIASKKKWISFNGRDGLPGSDFAGFISPGRKGEIIAGLEGALAVFHPEKLNFVSRQLPAIITEAAATDATLLFPLGSGQGKKLQLPAGRNSFSVDFAIPGYYNTASLQYLYKLAPLMNEFRANDNGHINFNGLMPGHYTLFVKGEDKTGDLNTREDKMDIVIAPFWYQSWWFGWTALLLLTALAIFLVKRRISAIRNESALKQKVIETEMQALRAQMDPHFIFNSLSSIENFIMQNEKRLASDYLNKFAWLIRMILDSSRNEQIPLAKDMEALQLYIDLEQISCNNKFIYKAIIDPILLNEDYNVPPLLIQPYVENAIVHGLMPSRSEDLALVVIAKLEADMIRYIVEDNGIGRQQAQQYRIRNKPFHKSVGLKITEERINIFNRQTRSNGSVVITDLYDRYGAPRGTRVEITIKAM